MTSVATIHHPLCHVDTGTGYIGSLVYIQNDIDGTAMDSHPQPNLGMIFYGRTNLHGRLNGRFMIAEKDERHPIASRQANQFLLSFSATKPGAVAHNTINFRNDPALLRD